MMRKLKIVLIAVIVFLSLAAFKTAAPAEATKNCLLGYRAFCSFAPVSTIILAIVAILTFVATKKIILG